MNQLSKNDQFSKKIMGFNLFNGKLPFIDRKKEIVVNTVNAYSAVLSNKDEKFKSALNKSDILLPDGVSMVIAARFLANKKIKKIAGMDAFNHYINEIKKIGGTCFFLGSNSSTLSKIQLKLERNIPGIRVGVYSPPYKNDFSYQDNYQMLYAINSFKPDVLFVGMTAPKQEKWVFENKDNLRIPVICSIGAVFDYYAGNIHRAPKFARDMGFEWFWRLLKEPKRTWRRYLIGNTQFLILLIKHKFS